MSAGKLKKNFIYNVAYQILTVVTPLITSPYVSRILGAENLGIHDYSFSVAEYFVLFAMLGTKNYGNRQIAMVRDDKEKLSETFWNVYTIQLFASIMMLALYSMYTLFFCNSNVNMAVVQGIYLLEAAADISWFFFGMEEFQITVTRNALIRVGSIICIFIFVKSSKDLLLYSLILSGSMFAGHLSVFPFLKKYVKFSKPIWNEMKPHIKPNLLLFIPVIAVGIFNIMDKIMLGWMSDYVQVGYYGRTEKLMRIPLGIITALGTVMMPHMSHMIATGNKEKSKQIVELSMVSIMCMGAALATGLAGIGKNFAPVFWGDGFTVCGRLIIFMSPTVLSLSWANVIRMQYLLPNKMDTEFTISTIVGAVVNLCVNMALIPHYGALGAVWGTVCAETALTIYQTYVVRKFLPIKRYLLETIPFSLIGLVMGVTVHRIGNVMQTGIFTLVIQVFAGVAIYTVLTLIYFIVNNAEGILYFRELLFGTLQKFTGRIR